MSPSLQLSIRPGQSTDVPAVLALLQGAGLPTGDLTSAKGLKMWVLEARDSLLGVIALEGFGTDALLRSLAVAPEYRQRGFGQELVARLEQDAQADGVEPMTATGEFQIRQPSKERKLRRVWRFAKHSV